MTGEWIFSDLAEVTDKRWVDLFIDLILAGWTVADIAEGYGFHMPKLACGEVR